MRSITGTLLGLFALSSGKATATQMLGQDVAQAQLELRAFHHEQALFFANRAIKTNEYMAQLAGLNIKAMAYMDLNDVNSADLAITELAVANQLSYLEQKAQLQELYTEFNEIRLSHLAA
ncbi:hypothetical protein K6Y31_19880 [Motilimonas cestriensis]|uniref:TolC family protein n=1 Tax=Motilimonas cestriensis TaxID=2742685 RepID=A0ABS8WEX5_9GAMM|nr:hypothetical protein [Motilimonas cestriensis]MCE2597040.1 hypothetical protein [Motilimonas cestriensis]